jgi:dihydrofolate reductase
MLSLVVAQSRGRVIGAQGGIPWYMPADLKHFRELTTGRRVIMGRRTYDSIVAKLGGPLPNRINIVVTRDDHYRADGAVVVHSLNEAIKQAGEGEIMVAGGAVIFEQCLPLADRIYLTQIEADITGDTFMPELGHEWAQTSREEHAADEHNPYDYAFITLDRRNA